MRLNVGMYPVAHEPEFSSSAVALPPPSLPETPLDAGSTTVWSRGLPAAVAAYLERVAAGDVVEVEQDALDGRADVGALVASLPPGEERAWLRRDIEGLLARLVRFAGYPRFLVSLGPVVDDQCRRFHVDRVHLRVLVTYAGPGTEWVPDEAVARGALGRPFGCNDEANAAVVPDATRIQRAGAGDVVWLKGQQWPGEEARGAVHRSPPLGTSGVKRLVFKATVFGGGGGWGS